MRTILLTMIGLAAAACAAILAPAGYASAERADLTIATLEAQGFDVKVNRLGSAPLSECEVTDVRNAREQTKLVRRGDDLIEVVDRRTISVTADCTRR